jgi:hypothetical protein
MHQIEPVSYGKSCSMLTLKVYNPFVHKSTRPMLDMGVEIAMLH